MLMDRVALVSGLSLRRAQDPSCSAAGEYVRLASREPSAPAGVVKILTSSRDEVRHIHQTLQGRFLQVGPDFLGVEIHNDVVAARGLQGEW